jgi:hypothetical protein
VSWSYQLYRSITYKLDLGLQVLGLDVMADLHVLDVHLHLLILFELFEAVGSLEQGLLQRG